MTWKDDDAPVQDLLTKTVQETLIAAVDMMRVLMRQEPESGRRLLICMQMIGAIYDMLEELMTERAR